MIVSVSRRTDIPALYSDWFYRRLCEGEVLIRNTYNRKQVSRVPLTQDMVDCFVFWTKNPEKMMENINLLKGYNYYFQFTLNSYGKDIETNIPPKSILIETFKKLSSLIGREKVIWRYDPILLNNKYTKEYHFKWFEVLASKLSQSTDRCVISFVDIYKETKKNMDKLSLQEITYEDMLEIGNHLVKIANNYGIEIQSCGEKMDLSSVGINHGSCIDGRLISEITGKDFSKEKKDNMREACGCIRSVDIGQYNSCTNKCMYCYANFNSSVIDKYFSMHDVNSKLLIGNLSGDEKITDHYLCKEHSAEYRQLNLLDGDINEK